MLWLYALTVVLTMAALVFNLFRAQATESAGFELPRDLGVIAYGAGGGWWSSGLVALAWWFTGANPWAIVVVFCLVYLLPWLFRNNPRIEYWQGVGIGLVKALRSS